nr:DMT family transporter [uncultured Oscillibacter sp.]
MKRLAVLLGVAGVSLSAVFVRWSTAPSLILVLYRVGMAAALLAPYTLLRHREELRTLARREVLLCLASGAFLGLHFAAYFESLRWTSIASSVVLVDTEVLFVALDTVLVLRQRLPGRAWLAVALAFGGSVVIAMADTAVGPDAVRGDIIALSGALCMAVYTMIGAVCRKNISTTVYTFLVYCSAALTVLVIALFGGLPLTGYGAENVLTALGMAVFCTLLGHSVFSWGLKYLSPAFISTAKLLEPVFASVWGLALFGERPGLLTLLGGAVIIAGVALYSRTTGRETERKVG